jgi:hypothetical protein
MASGLLQDAAAGVADDNVSQGLIPPIDANVRCAIGLAGERIYPVLNTVDATTEPMPTIFYHAEPAAALAFGGKRSAAANTNAGVACPIPIAGRLSRVTNPSDMPVHIRRLVNDFSFGDRTQLDPVVPSLLRLALLHVALVPRFKDGTLGHAVARLTTGMKREAAMLAPYIAPCRCWLQPQQRVRQSKNHEQLDTADDGDRLCTEASAH